MRLVKSWLSLFIFINATIIKNVVSMPQVCVKHQDYFTYPTRISSWGVLNCPNLCSRSHTLTLEPTTDGLSITYARSSETGNCSAPQPPAAVRRRHIGAQQAHIMILNMPPCQARKHELWSYFCITAGKAVAVMLFARFRKKKNCVEKGQFIDLRAECCKWK